MKNLLVTGAAGGIGSEIATSASKKGYRVGLIDQNSEKLKEVEAKIENSISLPADITKEDSVNQALDLFGETPDGLVNCAGIVRFGSLLDQQVKDFEDVINVNLNGTYICCKSIVPLMIKNNYGRIVNIASVSGKDGNANASAYSSAKAGVLGLTKSLGKELADKNIAVNAVTPAGAKTRILDQMTKEHVQRMLSKVPRGRFLEVEEFTSLVCWLSSEENTFSTAAVFDISGGRSTY